MSLHLNVQVGSLMEEPHEHGIAHFVEHMAFNGTKNFPAGSLIPFFQKHGMSFGGDSNAHTSFYETVYKLDLPTTQQEDITMGLKVLRDFADGILFADEEVEKERGVILAEKTARDSEAYQANQFHRNLLFPNSRFTNLPIGTEEVISKADKTLLKNFYDRWYTPQRMILVVAGDIDTAAMQDHITSHFSSMKERPAPSPAPSWGNPTHTGLSAHYLHRPKATGTTIALTSMLPREHLSDSEEAQKELFLQTLWQKILNLRLQDRQEADSTLWLRGRASVARSFGLFPTWSLTVQATKETWQNALQTLEHEIRNIMTNGVFDSEIDEARQSILAELANRVKDYPNMLHADRAGEAIASFNADRVLTSPEQDLKRFQQLNDTVGRQEIMSFFRSHWKNAGKIVYVSGDVDLPNKEQDVLDVYKTGTQKPLRTVTAQKRTPFPYLPLPEDSGGPLPEADITLLADGTIQVHTFTLPNGMTVQLAPSSLGKERVSALLLFGDGLKHVSPQEAADLKLAEAVLAKHGPGKLMRAEAIRHLHNKKILISENITAHGNVIGGSAPSQHRDLLIQAIWTQFLDPSLRQSTLDTVLQELQLAEEARRHSVTNTVQFMGGTYFYGDSPVIKPLSADMAKAPLPRLQEAIAKTRQTHRLHLIVLGDFDMEPTAKTIAQLFGQHQLTPANSAHQPTPYTFPESSTPSIVKVDDPIEKSTIISAWRADLPVSSEQTLTARRLLASILRDAMREELRENMGASYSPLVHYRVDETDNGYGMFQVSIETDTRQTESVRQALNTVLTKVAKGNITQQTLDRLRAPMLTAWKTSRGKNDIWLRLLQQEYLTGLPLIERNDNHAKRLLSVSLNELKAEAAALVSAPTATLVVTSSKTVQE